MFMHGNLWLINVTIDHGHHKKISLNKFYFFTFLVRDPGGGGTSLWVRRGCAPVLGSFWPENSGIGVSF